MWTTLPFFNTSDHVAPQARRNALPAHDPIPAGLTKRVTVHLLALTCIHAHTTQAPTRTDDVQLPSILVSGLLPSWGACFGSRVCSSALGPVRSALRSACIRRERRQRGNDHSMPSIRARSTLLGLILNHASASSEPPPNSRLRGPTAAGALSRRPAAPRSG